jgi:hypothetical protein
MLGGRYRVGRRIGQGSIAQVVEARDERTGAIVALKILYPNLHANQVIADRFRREAEVVRRIAHPHVIAIHDVVEDGGVLFLVMDLHAGGDLADRLARGGPLPAAALRELGRQLGGALAAAHRAGVVHRDVKPQNVLVGPDPAALDTRLVDFGLARTADLAGLTTRSTVLGTPEYMAPEVIADGYADPRSDVYSLGVVLFEAATGRLPFRASSPFQLLRKHLTETPPRAASARPDLPPDIDEAIARALAKDPLDRFAGAADFAAALAPPSAGTVALAARRAEPAAAIAKRAVCRRCGGTVVAAARTCVDCGARSLRLGTVARGRAVLVTGPGKTADKIDGASHVALVKLLEELPPGTVRFDRLRKKPPRLPFFVAADLDDGSAAELAARLRDLGFEARVEQRASLAAPELRRKGRRMGFRYFWMFMPFVPMLINTTFLRIIRGGKEALLGYALIVVGGLATSLVAPAIAYRRPLVARLDAAGELPALTRLAQWLARLRRREDRRLLGRILDRLELATSLGAGELAELLANRADVASRGLVALDERSQHLEEADPRRALAAGDADDRVREALGTLRETERLRGVMLADLLRALGRAEELCTRLARAQGLDAREQAALLARELGDLQTEIAADEDVAALLS